MKNLSKILDELQVAGPALAGDEEGDDIQGMEEGGVVCHGGPVLDLPILATELICDIK